MSRAYPTNFIEKVLSWKPVWLERNYPQTERPLEELVDAERLPPSHEIERAKTLETSSPSPPFFAGIHDYSHEGFAESRATINPTATKKYYDRFLPLVAGESYAQLVEGYNSNDKMRWFNIKFISKTMYPGESCVTLTCQGRLPKDYAESTIANVLYIPHYYPSQTVLGFASYTPDENGGKLRIKIPNITPENAYSEPHDALPQAQVLKVKFLHSLVTEMRIYEACKLATSLPYMDQLLAGKLDYTVINEGERVASQVSSAEIAGGGGGGGGKEKPKYVLGVKSMLGDIKWNVQMPDRLHISSDPAEQASLISEILKRSGHQPCILTSENPEILLKLAHEWTKEGDSSDMQLVGFDDSSAHSLIKYTTLFSALQKKKLLTYSRIPQRLLIPIDKLLAAEKGTFTGMLIFLNEQKLDEAALLNLNENFPSFYSFEIKSGDSKKTDSPRLNVSQEAAIKRVLMTDDPLMLLQGPPGTGKTTTTVALLEELIFSGKTMVCGPSNKAVQVLADRFFNLHPEWPIILVGVDKKIPEHLLPISLHSFHAVVKRMIDEFDRLILDATKLKLPQRMEEYVNKYLGLHKFVSLSQFIDLAIGKISGLENLSHISLDAAELKALRESEKSIKAYLAAHPEIKEALLASQTKIPGKIKKILPNLPNLMQRLNKKFQNYELEGFIKMIEKSSEINIFSNAFLNTPAISLEKALEIVKEIRAYFTLCKSGLSDKRELERILLGSAKVIFCTLSVSGRSNFHSDLGKLDYLVVDEAGQAPEALTLVPMQHRPRRLLLVGDTKQLPATVLSEGAKAKRYDWSLMWRLFEENQQRADMLTIQYRMHAKICRWPSLRFYDGRLVTDPVVEAARKNVTPPCELLKRPRAFYNLPSEQEQPVVSYRNKLEAAYILAIVKHIRTVDRVNTIGVISFYSAQVLLLTYLLEKYLDKKTRVSTVDGFQGDECHYILLSCVRSQFSIGFLSDFRRLNVSITRPMCNLLVIGNLPFLVQKTSDLQVMIQDMIENGEVVEREELDQLLNLDSKAEVSKLLDAMAQFRISEERHVGTGDMVASQKNICFQYNGKPGSCHFGNRCKFLHQAKSSSGGQRGDQRGYHGGGGGGGGRKW